MADGEYEFYSETYSVLETLPTGAGGAPSPNIVSSIIFVLLLFSCH